MTTLMQEVQQNSRSRSSVVKRKVHRLYIINWYEIRRIVLQYVLDVFTLTLMVIYLFVLFNVDGFRTCNL